MESCYTKAQKKRFLTFGNLSSRRCEEQSTDNRPGLVQFKQANQKTQAMHFVAKTNMLQAYVDST